MTLFDLSGKVAIVTGSTKGIGEAIAHRFAEHGAKVVVSSRKAEMCDKVAGEINEKWGKGEEVAYPVPCNIGVKEELQNLVDRTNDKWGMVTTLVCNAAVNPFFGSTLDIPDDAFERIMKSNIQSNHWLCNMVLPQMIERRDGSITIISSIGGHHGNTVIGAYCISKAADMQLARNLAAEFGEHNIRANAIAPGLIKTYFAKALWSDPEILENSTSGSALKRIGAPDEIAGAAVFLASAAGAFVTGQTINVDGGVTAL
ncbi:MAG TPA: short-chain dehydrogenase [Alphaproteobacteria bacterium]|jgi:NAD(P)-dependent dehydrogenase (short-subunit alcohol dehydrogenase family)|nr:short-chain dehydrogenase [Alphaproteobacteria bacterium]HBA43843.1 short-chain dehydrogenase [Alphaproteobacteria bacterium]HBC53294.1 short-chain dehydrogenase [Alphaproteobacteria bacterium]HBF97790.1 short-chain dehydrogenase [Alphaproteobacteria bacterium]HCO90624.1 short-chain dehydrogenase [Alphaproteobacteria bacterium]